MRNTIRVPDVAGKLHGRRHERVVLWELELGGKDAVFVGRAFGAGDQGFPHKQVVFFDGAGGDALGWILGQVFVFLEQSLGCDRGGHGGECSSVYQGGLGAELNRESSYRKLLKVLCFKTHQRCLGHGKAMTLRRHDEQS